MIYPADFIYNLKRLNSRDKNVRNKGIFTISLGASHREFQKKLQTGKVSDESIWIRYLNNSTVHGFRYLTDPTIRRTERITWFVLVVLALFGVVYVCFLLQVKFSTNVLATVVETTFFPVYEIPYPAITICNNNRIHWGRVPAAIDHYLQNATNLTTSKLLESFIDGLNGFEFGSFDEFVKIKDIDLNDLDHINLKDLYKRNFTFNMFNLLISDLIFTSSTITYVEVSSQVVHVQHVQCFVYNVECTWEISLFSCTGQQSLFMSKVGYQCEELFMEPCWWRNRYMNCCDNVRGLFVQQETEYGICYTFNSVLNSVGESRTKNATDFPWRTSSFGDWSGLRVNVILHDSDSNNRYVKNPPGILVMANHPFSWPGSAYFVPKGTSTAVIIKPSYSYTTSDVQRLLPVDRKCLYPDELSKYQYETLPGTLYFRSNCLAECRQRHMIANCNCTIDFLYPTADYPICNISSFKCLYNFDALFNYERPPKGNPYFSEEEEGISCDCLPECESIDYSLDVSPIQRMLDADDNTILVDFHFQQSTMVKYRTSIVFGWLDLMVAFGGIAGLFLGCSLISVVEVAFYVVVGLSKLFRTKTTVFDWKRRHKPSKL